MVFDRHLRTTSAAIRPPSQSGRYVKQAAAGMVIALAVSLAAANGAAAVTPPGCASPAGGGPLWVTADCVDPEFNRPVIDSETDMVTPVPHRKVSGHFDGTDAKFNIYLPSKESWEGRFFQKLYPLQGPEATEETIAFAASSGGYAVQTSSRSGYRIDAAAAKFSEVVAAEYYGKSDGKIYGYAYGGSGGSLQTIGAIENSVGVWDGAVPYVVGLPVSITNNYFSRSFARIVLKDKAPQIADTVSPGGSGDPYAGLNEAERQALGEVTKLGLPLRAWEDYAYAIGLTHPAGLHQFAPTVRRLDPTYVDDFWSKPGYLGTEQSALGQVIREAKTDHMSTIVQVNRDAQDVPTSLVLGNVPVIKDPVGFDYTAYDADGTVIGQVSGSLDPATKVFTIAKETPAKVLNSIDAGDSLRIDNRWFIALSSYHRHQVPTEPGYDAWDQLRSADGTPIYPQRAREIGPIITRSVTGGGTHTGKVNGKVIMVNNLIDSDAFTWHGDWYAQRMKKSLGETYDNNVRHWYNDNADHLNNYVVGSGEVAPNYRARIVEYKPSLQQALRDVSAWAEKGIEPPKSTKYQVNDGQVSLPANAAVRGGIQPVIDLTARGKTRIEVKAGQPVTFTAKIQIPPKTGKIVAADWDYMGTGNFAPATLGNTGQAAELQGTFTYTEPGTYYPGLRAKSERNGDTSSGFAQIQNLDRIRVIVR